MLSFTHAMLLEEAHSITGVILPHDHFGMHLDAKGQCIDPELERLNFQRAGNILAELWNKMTISGCQVSAKYISPGR